MFSILLTMTPIPAIMTVSTCVACLRNPRFFAVQFFVVSKCFATTAMALSAVYVGSFWQFAAVSRKMVRADK